MSERIADQVNLRVKAMELALQYKMADPAMGKIEDIIKNTYKFLLGSARMPEYVSPLETIDFEDLCHLWFPADSVYPQPGQQVLMHLQGKDGVYMGCYGSEEGFWMYYDVGIIISQKNNDFQVVDWMPVPDYSVCDDNFDEDYEEEYDD